VDVEKNIGFLQKRKERSVDAVFLFAYNFRSK